MRTGWPWTCATWRRAAPSFVWRDPAQAPASRFATHGDWISPFSIASALFSRRETAVSYAVTDLDGVVVASGLTPDEAIRRRNVNPYVYRVQWRPEGKCLPPGQRESSLPLPSPPPELLGTPYTPRRRVRRARKSRP